ncbi:hypothetical protein HAX54_037991 [Datura stramonium]|uniref:Uncharacterized protein n=1 Tax=Datura stramonium TaxID=4076 RepID=A0ABS8VM06_DATST|nr:hypothetical protein [Datura stramonium]
MMGQKFGELVKISEAIEDGLKTRKVVSRVVQAGSAGFSRKKKEDVSIVSVITLQTTAPNVNNNPLPNHGEGTINMIEVEEDWHVSDVLTKIQSRSLEQEVSSLTVNEKPAFVAFTPHMAFTLVQERNLVKEKKEFIVQIVEAQGIT